MDNTGPAREVAFKLQYTITGGIVVTSPYETKIEIIEEPNSPPTFQTKDTNFGKIELLTKSQDTSVV